MLVKQFGVSIPFGWMAAVLCVFPVVGAYAGVCASKADVKSIVETAASVEDFSTLVAAVKAAGLVETLSGEGPFTVFAPTNAAFAKLPEGTLESLLKPENKGVLTAILTYHVAAGKVMAADVVKLEKVETVQGESAKVKVEDGVVMIDAAKVVKTDIACTNGVIHIIDSVILPETIVKAMAEKGAPPASEASANEHAAGEHAEHKNHGHDGEKRKDIVEVASSSKDFTTLVALVKAAELVEALKGEGPLTVFAPSDRAFGKLPKGTVNSLLKPENKEKLAAILKLHVVSGKVLAGEVVKLEEVETLGGKLKIKLDGDTVIIGGAKVVKTDLECGNGVIHVIDSVILPE